MKKVKEKVFNYLTKDQQVFDLTFSYSVSNLVGMHKANQFFQNEWGASFIDQKFTRYKTSDTIFILGSGPSINNISEDQWNHIRQENSVGFNYWFIHDFVPDFYMFQMPPEIPLHEMTLNMLDSVRESYRDIPFIFRGDANAEVTFDTKDPRFETLTNGDLYVLDEYPIHRKVQVDINLILEYFELMGMLEFDRIPRIIPKLRSSVILLMVLAYQMGYKKIVLCGVDMNEGFEHFYDAPEFKKKYDELGLGIISENSMGGFHIFTSKKESRNTVPDYIKHLRKWMFDKAGVEVSILSEQTILHPDIPLYKM